MVQSLHRLALMKCCVLGKSMQSQILLGRVLLREAALLPLRLVLASPSAKRMEHTTRPLSYVSLLLFSFSFLFNLCCYHFFQ